MPGKCSFQDKWLKDVRFKDWILRDKDSKKARCGVCSVSLSLASMGESCLKVHIKTDRHMKNLSRHRSETRVVVPDFFSSEKTRKDNCPTDAEVISPVVCASSSPSCTTTSTTSSTSGPSGSTQRTLAGFNTDSEVLKAEILWCLKMVSSHYSYYSSAGATDLFRRMFPDSDIARQFTCGETKSRYLITFGLAPYFLQQLTNSVKRTTTGYVLLFDESHNHKNKLKQMDFHVRFWDDSMVKTRYLTSEFLGHARGVDLFEKITSVLSEFSLTRKNLLQLGMDGPAVNWNVYNRVHSSLKDDENVGLIHTGSCGLHTVHNAFKAGNSAAKWNVDAFLTAAYYLFRDSPARREDFFKLFTGSQAKLPLKFCSHRWLENASVAEHCLQILPLLEQFVKAALDRKIAVPECKSFETVKAGVLNAPLVPCRLAFFRTVAREIEPFLKKYQTDQPFMPYLSTDLQNMLKKLMRRFLTQEALEGTDTAEKLMSVDITNTDNQCSLSEIDVGFQTRALLQKVKKTASDRTIMEFKSDCKKFLMAVVNKLLEKCPLKHSVVRNMACLNPENMKNKQLCKDQMQALLLTLCGVNRLEHPQADTILNEYQDFLDTNEATDFDPSLHRLDSWFIRAIGSSDKFKNLWGVVQILLVLSHGQSSVERGFSYNKEVIEDNLSQRALKARRVILDHIQDVGGVLNVNLSKKLLLACGRAHSEYTRYLEEERKLRVSAEKEQMKRKKTEEIETLRKKKKTAEADAKHLVIEADQLSFDAQEQRSFTLVARSNQLRLSAKDKQAEVSRLETQLTKLQEELTSIKAN